MSVPAEFQFHIVLALMFDLLPFWLKILTVAVIVCSIAAWLLYRSSRRVIYIRIGNEVWKARPVSGDVRIIDEEQADEESGDVTWSRLQLSQKGHGGDIHTSVFDSP